MAGERMPIFDFPVLSDDRVHAGRSLAEAGPGEQVFSDETVWELVGDWERGRELGSVSIEETPTNRPGRTLFRATFDLADHGPIVVTGFVPGEGTWVGVGRGAAHGVGRHGEVRIEGRNPKSWG
ncbi:MAG TPA: hypothetical protein VJ259_00495 [Actinomycetota bacterium]|nr:hypothetical protein [Actinomycetota bacterium]